MTVLETRRTRSRRPAVVATVSLLVVALNLRGPFVGVSTVVEPLRTGLGISSSQVGLLTGLPVLCFALCSPVALVALRRLGAEEAILVCLGAVVAGSLVRSGGTFALAVGGTLVVGAGITIGNLAVPVLIRRDLPPGRVELVTGAYSAVLNIGATTAIVTTAPVSRAVGWQLALLTPVAVALVSAAWWWRVYGASHRRATPGPERGVDGDPVRQVWRDPAVLLLTLAFAGQSASYYAITAWLPSILEERAHAGDFAGELAAVFQLAAIISAVGMPVIARRAPEWVPIVAGGALWALFPLQLLVAPDAYLPGSIVGGAGQGAGLAAILTTAGRLARTHHEAASVVTVVQGGGYVVAAGVPSLLGALYDASGSWSLPLALTLGSALTILAAGGSSAAISQHRRRTRPAGQAG